MILQNQVQCSFDCLDAYSLPIAGKMIFLHNGASIVLITNKDRTHLMAKYVTGRSSKTGYGYRNISLHQFPHTGNHFACHPR